MNLKKVFRNTFLTAIVCSCVLSEQQKIMAQEIAPTKITAQIVRNDTGEVIGGLTADDFRLYQDGREQKILSVKRETRPLSVVIAFVTTPYRCSDGLGRNTFELAAAFQKTLAADEDLAIVMTDKNGQIVRNFNSETASMRNDFSKAERLAKGNAYSDEEISANPNSGYENIVFEIYPLPALQAALKMLRDNAPQTNERVILFVNTLQNTNVGKSVAGRTLLNDLIKDQVIVSRIGNGNAEKSFDLSNVPFGKRNFYLGITNFTGGESQGCPGQTLFDLFGSPPEPSGVSLENELTEFLNRLRTRYHISYRSNDRNAKELRSVRLELANSDKNKNVLLSYPKAVKIALK